MVPRPEEEKDFPQRRANNSEPIYSNSSDDDCAKLVKAGQLDTYRFILAKNLYLNNSNRQLFKLCDSDHKTDFLRTSFIFIFG